MATIPVVNDKDKQWGVIASVFFMLLIVLYILIYSIPMADPPVQHTPLAVVAEMEEIDLEELIVVQSGGVGGGTPNNDPLDKPKDQTEEVISDKNSNSSVKVPDGKSNKTNSNKPNTNTPTSTNQSKDPFGTGGKGGGPSTGESDKFGKDDGTEGEASGPSSGKNRSIKSNINTNDIYVSSTIIVSFIVVIDENGRVISARPNRSKTTTNDQRIINQVEALCKSQLKYTPSPGSGLIEKTYTVQISPNN